MNYIRKGKDITVAWPVYTNGEATSLDGRDLTLLLITPGGPRKVESFTTTENVIYFTFRGTEQYVTGAYGLTLWENVGKTGQTVVDTTKAFVLVKNTELEQVNEGSLTSETITLEGGTVTIASKGESAYDVAVDNGFVGTEEEWLESLKAGALEEYKDDMAAFHITSTGDLSSGLTLGLSNKYDATTVSITGLKTELDAKANKSHTHSIVDVTGLGTALDAKQDDLNEAQLEAVNSGISAQTLNRLTASVDKKIEGATINGTDLAVSNNKVAIPLTSSTSAGVVIVPTINDTSELSNYAENVVGSYKGTVLPKIATSSSYGVVKVDESELSDATDKASRFFFSELMLDENKFEVSGTKSAIEAAHVAMANNGKTILIQCSSNNGLYIPTSPHLSASTACFSFVHMDKSYTVEIDSSDNIVTTYQDISNVQSKLTYYTEDTVNDIAKINAETIILQGLDGGVYVDDSTRLVYGNDDKIEVKTDNITLTTGSSGGTINLNANMANYNGSEIVNDDYMGSALATKADASTVETLSGQVDEIALEVNNKADASTTYTKTEVDDKLSAKATTAELLEVQNSIPTKTSELANDSGYVGTTALEAYLKVTDAQSNYQAKGDYATASALSGYTTTDTTNAIDARLKVVEAYIELDESLADV